MYERQPVRRSGLVRMSDGQGVHYEESGAAGGIPALYLHGGPGGGLGARGWTTKLDPDRYRVVGFDQRGCGRSVPLATDPEHDLDANTAARLIADIEELREHLGVRAWVVNGVSWGSTLAIAYAQAHPERVLGVVAMAVTTTSRAEVEWITETVGALYPEEWDRFAALAEGAGTGYRRGSGRLVEAYARLMRHDDPAVRDAASRAWARWEDVHVAIGAGGYSPGPRWEDATYRHCFTTLTTHYWANDGFCDPPLLETMDRLHGIPAVLVHGRRDVSGPVRTVWEVHRHWPGSRLVVVEDEGHGGPAMVEAWCAANDEMAARLGGAGTVTPADRPKRPSEEPVAIRGTISDLVADQRR